MSLFRLAGRMNGVESSPTVRLNAMAQEMIREGKDVINLTAGETDFDTPEAVRSAAIKAIEEGKNKYTAPHGIPELRKAISDWFSRDFSLTYAPNQITTTVGVKQGIFNLILAVVGAGDEVIIPAPFWVSYPEMVKLAGGTPVILPAEQNFSLNIEEIKKRLSSKTRLILLNSPNNPSGGMYSKKEMLAIASLLEGTDVLVSSDEIYSSLVYEGEFVSFASLSKDAYERTITFNGLSKSHAMTGWRIGFAAGAPAIINAMGILQAQSSTHVTSFVQYAAIAALKQTAIDFKPYLEQMRRRRDLTVKLLREIPGVKCEIPHGAFYAFPDVSVYCSILGGSEKVAEYLLQDAGIAVVPGKPFGNDQCIRLSFAKDLKSLESAFSRMKAALQKIYK